MTNWQEIVGRHSGLVWRTAYRLLGNEADAADCYQEAFVSALELSRRQRVGNWPGLLQQLATRRALDVLRDRSRERAEPQAVDWAALPSGEPGPAQQAEAAELSERLRTALAGLTDGQAEVFCLRYVSQLSYREIAHLLGMKRSAVGVALHRARHRLAEILAPRAVSRVVEVPHE